ncbi:substrate-binding domain-containing protein [Variovorax sp. PAMC26660]|uniref:substrate-binding domain-containing protein n=1 Tax=Variovorax sp. PAMC26660 TaxID=2762322 RepID=UPI00164DD8F1|nr:substrate-binding domain-containing protein [Variovorax sp. PAMC26660]QNK67000.1 substrate-binding domain-containing protein [Variovorax sp. PAMC26660]
MNAKFKTVALSAVMMAGLMAAGAVSAQTAVGGGATLPEALYKDLLPSGVGLTDYTYTGTGSGAGKKAFLNNNPQATSGSEFRDESQSTRPIWPTTQSVHFAGSDSALTQAELDAYNPAHLSGWGPVIQVTGVGTAVLVPYKRSGIANLNLTDAQMCAVFSNKTGGQTWGQLRGTSDTTTVKVIYRTETSGTTELLSRYLKAACPTSNFTISNSFATVVGTALTGGTIPAHWVGATGSDGVKAALTTDSRLGYLSPDPAYTGSSNAVVARVNGNLPTAASIQTALGAQSLPLTGDATKPLNWVPAYVKPTPATGTGSVYPIFGTTNLLVNQCYANAGAQAKVLDFLTRLYDTDVEPHNFVNVPAAWKTAITNNFLTASSNLGIGNTNVCNGIGRP